MLCSEKEIIEAAGLIVNARHLVAFTGAGISVESGIPPFRGEVRNILNFPGPILPPRCSEDQEVLKPDFVFFGEGIPTHAAGRSVEEVTLADVLLIIGTTGEVMPAGMLPSIAKSNGAKIIEINPQRSSFTNSMTDLFLQGPAGEISKQLDSYLF